MKEGPGVRIYKGKRTLFYNGEKLWEGSEILGHPLVHDKEERLSWEVIIVLPGVELVPEWTFHFCHDVKMVIMADTVRRIEGEGAFKNCCSLKFVKLSTTLECIGRRAFYFCASLTAMFIPPSCREIDEDAFSGCKKLIIFHVPQTTELGTSVISNTALIRASPFKANEYSSSNSSEEENPWIKNLNQGEEYAMHRVCSLFNPHTEIIFEIVNRDGLQCFKKKNKIGITPAQYLDVNPFAEIDQIAIAKRYVLEMMCEIL